ncbi:MAG: CBS domain-containing protein, partial [Nitrospirota bacterium]|nr:CBS domain-containing protein [Nitrospirota bacterium]
QTDTPTNLTLSLITLIHQGGFVMSNLAEVMRKNIKSVKHTSPISEAAQLMKQDRVSALLVKQHNDFVGILTDTDIVRKGVAESKDLTSMTVQSIMTAPLVTIGSHQSPREAQEMMSEEGVRHLVVREGKTITGMVSIRDLLVFYKSRAETTYSEPRIGID